MAATVSTPAKRGQGLTAPIVQPRRRRDRLLEPVVAPEHLVAGGDGRDAEDAAIAGAVGLLAQPRLDGGARGRLGDRVRVQLAGGGGDRDVVGIGQVATARKRLPERGERERDRPADRLRVRRYPHRMQCVRGEGIGPANRLQRLRLGAALDLPHAFFTDIRQ